MKKTFAIFLLLLVFNQSLAYSFDVDEDIKKVEKDMDKVSKCIPKISTLPQKEQIKCIVDVLEINHKLININYHLYYNNIFLMGGDIIDRGSHRNVWK